MAQTFPLLKILHVQRGPLCGSSSPLSHFEPAKIRPNQASIQQTSAGWSAQFTASIFHWLHQYGG